MTLVYLLSDVDIQPLGNQVVIEYSLYPGSLKRSHCSIFQFSEMLGLQTLSELTELSFEDI
jgi:hypothetical protein